MKTLYHTIGYGIWHNVNITTPTIIWGFICRAVCEDLRDFVDESIWAEIMDSRRASLRTHIRELNL
jgi:hypothetical protein